MQYNFNDKKRFTVITAIVGIIVAALVIRLFYLQIIVGANYSEQTKNRINMTFADKAPRGEIMDRFGNPLVTNRLGYSLRLHKSDISGEELNKMILEIVNILKECDYDHKDSLPISDFPFKFTFEDENSNGSVKDEKEKWFSSKKKLTKNMTAREVIKYYRESVYNISESYSDDAARAIIGVRYDIDMSGFSATSPYTIASDVDVDVITRIKESDIDFKGVTVEKDYFRNYNCGNLAAHILGGTGKISSEEYSELKNSGYGYNDLIGKRGVEKIYESELKGKDGVKSDDKNIEDVAAVPGNYVVLTLDADLQRATEESLEKRITDIAKNGGSKTSRNGGDADSGAAVVLDVKSGAVLSCATYPTYNPATFNKDYKELVEDDANPMWNRAISGGYAPGSTFKPLVAIAALETNSVTSDEYMMCDGIYKYFKDYQPKCWVYSSTGAGHGELNIVQAIQFSCNCYFYEAGRRTGIDAINKYAKMFGLGDTTGLGLPEEAKGNISNPEYKAKVERLDENKKWYHADTIITAIGQSYSYFTPIQLANYVAAIANGGTLYKTYLLKSIRSTVDGSVIEETEPSVLGVIDVKQETLKTVKQGMYGVVDEGSASGIFEDYPISVGGKTGTAQVGSKVSDNALFVAFAPFDNPEIAVAVVIENGVKGANAAYVAKDIFDEYFRNETQIGIIDFEGELLP